MKRQTFQRYLGRSTARCSFGRLGSGRKGTSSRRLDEEDEGELWQREGKDDGDAVNELVGGLWHWGQKRARTRTRHGMVLNLEDRLFKQLTK